MSDSLAFIRKPVKFIGIVFVWIGLNICRAGGLDVAKFVDKVRDRL